MNIFTPFPNPGTSLVVAVSAGERAASGPGAGGAVAWIPRVGWTDDAVAIRERQDVGEAVYVVCHGEVGVDDDVLAAVMRIDAEREGLRARIIDVYEYGCARLAEH